MLKFIEKGFFYGLILGISLGVLIVPYKEVVSVDDSSTETTYLDLIDFIIPLLRVGVVVALVGAAIGFFLYKRNKKSLD
ncbi:hypothetical protein NQ109_28540 [Priestia megaterium]|uniref:hypothetical protein n=1 Tax=Priestia megaterium TaxID=1404 RepID=UPI00215B3334|nr:hypothetical protein [Priestia megaterium]MCR8866878.1 hypothetical protein [Priestia megaterium]